MEDMKKRGWTQADFVFVIGDAYVDHPSFGPAIISRLLERYGYKVCMIAQPDWKNDKSIWQTKTGLFGVRRQYGFHGEPLFCVQEEKTEGCVLSRWTDGTSA